jgi:hypothetical protein
MALKYKLGLFQHLSIFFLPCFPTTPSSKKGYHFGDLGLAKIIVV